MNMMTAFPKNAISALANAYPESTTRLSHDLSDHDLLKPEALIALSKRMRAVDQECYRGDVPVGTGPDGTPLNGLTVEETIRGIETNKSWIVLKNIEQDPAYAEMMRSLLSCLEDVVKPVTGPMLMLEAFIFISSPYSVTPFHMDPEHNILLQISGSKEMTVFSQYDRELAPQSAHESFLLEGHNKLAWREEYSGRGTAHRLKPGDALYVPVKAPHFVKNGDAPSISLSVTWRSAWSFAEADAHGFNAIARRYGLKLSHPKRFPRKSLTKAYAYRALRKLSLTGGSVRNAS